MTSAALRYSASVWEAEWPRIMGHVIGACQRHGVRLVFFDNSDYRFDSSRIRDTFGLEATSYPEGIAATLASHGGTS